MSLTKLDQVADVDIDDKGTFKYILINVKDPETKSEKHIVRGYKSCAYHVDIYDRVKPDITKLGLKTRCTGGGRIKHEPTTKTILIYGYSQGFGQAKHSVTHQLIKDKYSNYTDVAWTNDGY